MDNSNLLLQTRRLTISIANIEVCNNLDWNLESNEVWGILGLNGAGKTTLLNTLAGLHKPSSGQIRILNKPLEDWSPREMARQLGYLFQSLPHEFPQTVNEFCADALHPYIGHWQNISIEQQQLISLALKQTDLNDFHQRLISTLSGGEKRRTEIAGLLVQNPRLWLLDEPVNHLDLHHQINMMEILIEAARRKSGSIISIFHDPNLARRFCTHILFLYGDGKHQSGIAEDILNADNLTKLYRYPVSKITEDGKSAFIVD
jgi:iron complex transport system ATP-binding protein